jgi:hypothetical protein
MRSIDIAKVASTLRDILVIATLGFTLAGCPTVQFVADYDDEGFEEILKVAKTVDRFYGDMLETPEAQRRYSRYSERYVEIETDIRSLWTRSQARPLNDESTRIFEIILNFWVKYKAEHKEEGGYGDGEAKLERNRFSRLFAAAANAELAKKLPASDTNTGQ